MSLLAKQLTTYLALLAIGGGAGIYASRYFNADETRVSSGQQQIFPPAVQQISPGRGSSQDNLNFIAEAVEKVGPAVVRIDSARTVSQQVPDAFRNPFFRRFFGNEMPIPPEDRIERGTGSGFILSSDGRLMTNAHVVAGADTVKVTLKDGRILNGRVVGTDPVTDVAVVKIDANKLPWVRLGDSENLIPGQWAIAIGNPLGLDNTVTVGIVSATGRSSLQVGVPDKRVRFIQTDAAINPGNSGGPLLNARGEVIGINTAIRANAQGLGFAIPIETASRVGNQLFSQGRAEHPYLGIQMVTITPDVKEEINKSPEVQFKLTQDKGVLIVRVVKNSPADRAGLREGDVIKRISGQQVNSADQVQERVEASSVGGKLEVEINRNGQNQNVQVQPGAFPVE
ncbi:trypsin-like peptidase domain-containing protein [Funiculus sociatus GB2-A5]|uniref:Trypsin-like peptidase domain-containing protein n=1 Tax=Funiculus sociatus GB2-A5 TaxID=2933946 RepID=A0ABV0JU05_9CYAN|nr:MULTISPECIES: HhoA/HhoB/HtrA family serine endopeptidase [unclassified Trichocoleus]MBD1908964.1 trypsin-like peptidase domain-containing protein [Trichocoleus sp. FACHB-832]MBD2062998.1 trypsin-like peptidase domain-containing protein [Trichocoleus sp. FACHB-6]